MKSTSMMHIGSTYAVPQHQKDAESVEIERLTQEFKAKGGVIQQLSRGERSELASGKKLSLREAKALAARENKRMFEKRAKDDTDVT